MWVVRDVLQILTAVDERQSVGVVAGVVVRVPALEGIGRPVGDVVALLAKGEQQAGEELDNKLGHILGHITVLVLLEVQHNLVEQAARGSHDKADVVEACNTGLVLGQFTLVEARAHVLERHVAVEGRVG